MDNNYAQIRREINNYLLGTVNDIIQNNDVPVFIVEDALTAVLARVKELSFDEYMREYMASQRKAEEPPVEVIEDGGEDA